MKILLASPRGFCAGVNMAIQSLDLTLQKFGPPVYVYHEIVHNQHVVNEFKTKGAIFVDEIEEIPDGSTLLFSAHGVSPEIREAANSRNLHAFDATCPLVTKVHLEAIKYAKEGYTILLIGHEGHDEVIGTMGEAPEAIILVEDEDAVRAFASRALASRGYTVLEADSGISALEQVDEHRDEIDLVISDVVMPEMDGPTLLRELRNRGMDVRIIFISGYAQDAFAKNLEENEKFAFLPKPFSLKQLAAAVKDSLKG